MVNKSKAKGKKKSGKSRIKTLNLKREVKDVNPAEKKKVKGGGGLAGGVIATTSVTQ